MYGLVNDVGILVTGVSGQLGYDITERLSALGIPHKGVTRGDFELTDESQTIRYISDYKPEAVIHCAAYTAVDKAEKQKELCYAVNVKGSRNVATACAVSGAKMMYISTDYVFSGEGATPYEVDSPKKPLNYYGLTKSYGEDEVSGILDHFFIVRTSWVFGKNGSNFVKTILRLIKERDKIDIVDDQVGSPTYTYDLAELLCDMILTGKYGIYHATNESFCSWYEFANKIMCIAGLQCTINPISTHQYPTAAKRPLNSRLSKKSLDNASFKRLPGFEDALSRFLIENRS